MGEEGGDKVTIHLNVGDVLVRVTDRVRLVSMGLVSNSQVIAKKPLDITVTSDQNGEHLRINLNASFGMMAEIAEIDGVCLLDEDGNALVERTFDKKYTVYPDKSFEVEWALIGDCWLKSRAFTLSSGESRTVEYKYQIPVGEIPNIG